MKHRTTYLIPSTIIVLLAVALTLAGCRQPFSASDPGSEITVPVARQTSISISFVVPDFTALMDDAAGIGPRAIAPQTATAPERP